MGAGASVPNSLQDDVGNAIEKGDEEKISQFIQNYPEQINNSIHVGNWTPLISAAFHGRNKFVKIFIATGADLNKARDGEITALMCAAGAGHKDVVKVLLEAGADNDKQDKDSCTALMLAAKEGHGDCVRILLEAGADKDKQDKDGNTALLLAADHNRMKCVTILLETGVDTETAVNVNESKEIAIMIAAKDGNPGKLFPLLRAESLRKGGGITDKIRAWCTRFPAILKHPLCVSFMFSDFDPFKEGDGVIGKDAARFWTKVLSSNDSQSTYIINICTVLDEHIDRLTDLENVRDPTGRRAIDVATPMHRKAMEDRHLFYKRYDLNEGPAEHTSTTCILKLGKDCGCDNKGQPVALKFMKNKEEFQRELESRKNGDFSENFVISIVKSFNGDEEEAFELEAKKRGLYRYCLVMQAAERNLGTVLAHEHIAGREWLQIRSITEQLVKALDHMHSKGFIHGDVKPLNIMRINNKFKLIDLDATVSIVKGAEEYVGAKYSSAYLPPEMIAILDNGTPVVRSYTIDESTGKTVTTDGLPYELVLATAAHDMWSLGVTLFQMYAGEPLFLMNDEGNLSQKQLICLYEWKDVFKTDRLLGIKDKQARNLISRLLSKDSMTRPDAAHVLAHPFVSGKQTARMIGEEAEYDVFISYRVASDAHHAEALYNKLTSLGLKVWWDIKCLAPGVPWEEGFCNGLVNSRAFVCLMSKGAIHHPTVQRQNFANLTKESLCDNVFLEYRLALELRDMGFIERVYPIMIGEVTDTGTYSRYSEPGSWASDVAVDTVESKLREHLERQGLGAPMKAEASPRDVLFVIGQNQGFFIQGELSESVGKVSNILVEMIRCLKEKDATVVSTETEIPLESKGKLSTVGNIDLITKEYDAKKNSATFTSRKMSSDNGYGALLEAQSMVVKLKTLIAESRLQSSSETLRDEVDNVIISSDGKELNKKVHDTMSDYRHFITLESSSKILTWQGKMNGNGNGNGNGNISNENSYRIRLRQEMEIDINNINSIITLAGGTIVIEIKFMDDSKLSKWETALRNTMSIDS